ncbi:GNAT family N-acetyltransferase [Hoeflea sp. G2-23]|uniref:GNAT family N-acetyltransferase n=1 Tax=Hoeflea algicola TaxID=2983763 RepID=A0ABT3Z6A4_9HYPH|nr:GNAT family N-acetyltransferase [Hoeflea algicola]MCY0147298.1 GNAT family N-acetyltransferase [Hoeflea algicola]
MPTLAELRNRVDQELAAGWQVTVAHVDHTIVGFVALKPRERILAELFLWPDQIGAGVGKRLLDHAKAVIPAGFELYTTSENSRARRFYEREGLRAFREARHPGSGHPVTYYRWRGR